MVTQGGQISNALPVWLSASGQDGTFDVHGLTSGSYVVVSHREEGGAQLSARQAVEVGDGDVDGVVLRIAPGVDIAGSMRIDGQAPGQEQDPRRQIGVSLVSVDGAGSGARGAAAEAEGQFVVRGVEPGKYLVVVSALTGRYLKSIRFGDQEVPSGQIEVGQAPGVLTLALATDGGQIDGTVEDANGAPASRAMVTVSPDGVHETRRDLFRMTLADGNGRFTLKDVAPGSYHVYAWEGTDPGAVQNLDLRKALESRATAVTVGATGRESVHVKAIPAADLDREKVKLP